MWRANRLSCFAAAAVVTMSGACVAQDRMGYAGFAIGQSETTFDSGATSGTGVARNKSGGLFLGYDITHPISGYKAPPGGLRARINRVSRSTMSPTLR